MFNAHLACHVVQPGRDIADGPDVRCARAADVVTHHAVGDVDAAAVEPFGGGPGTYTHQHQIGIELRAVRERDLLHPVLAADLRDTDTAPHVDALGAVQPGHQLTDRLPEHRSQRGGLRLHQHHVYA